MLLQSLKFDIQTHSLALEPLLKALYVSNDLSADFPSHAASLTLMVERGDSTHALNLQPISSGNGVFAETGLCGARCYHRGGRFYAAMEGHYAHEVEFDIDRNLIRANLSASYGGNPQAVLTNIVRPILQSFVLPFYHLKSLHGAVVTGHGRTLMLTGGGGTGKSTTGLRCLPAGYDLLSDDGPLFMFDRGNALVMSSLDYYHATANTLRLMPRLRDHVVGGEDVRGKFAIARAGLQSAHGWRAPRAVTHMIELRRQPIAVPRLVTVDRAAAAAALLGEAMIVFRPESIRANSRMAACSALIFDLIAALTRDAQILRLEFADHHLDELPAFLDDALSGG